MNSEVKWTKPPWRVYKGWVHPGFGGQSPQTTNSDTAICEPLGPDRIANAHLISAAPELYEALCDMLSDRHCLSDATIEFAYSAITKARGY